MMGARSWTTAALFSSLLACGALACTANNEEPSEEGVASTEVTGVTSQELFGLKRLPNNLPILNRGGAGASYSTQGFIDLQNPFHTPLGTNGRSCESCHLPTAGWSIRPFDAELMFHLSDGTDPIFNLLDANSPTADVSTEEARYASYSLLRQGLFRRGGAVPANAEFKIEAFEDPTGSGGSLTRFSVFRRSMQTANFQFTKNVGWHAQNTNGAGDTHAGLIAQARGNVTGAQQGTPAPDDVINSVVAYEEALTFAQTHVPGAGALDACGAKGGPENLSKQAFVAGRFNLFDAWGDPKGCGKNKARAKIYRGQEIFNTKTNARGGTCLGCHNAENVGSNVAGITFDIGVSGPEFRVPNTPIYTVRNLTTGEVRQTTDPGRALQTGKWADLNRFKSPALRGLAARPSYFHNGSARTLHDVIRTYEQTLGFSFTPQEEEDLEAFLNAL